MSEIQEQKTHCSQCPQTPHQRGSVSLQSASSNAPLSSSYQLGVCPKAPLPI